MLTRSCTTSSVTVAASSSPRFPTSLSSTSSSSPTTRGSSAWGCSTRLLRTSTRFLRRRWIFTVVAKMKAWFFFFSRSLALKRSSPLERHTWLLLGLEVKMSLASFVIFTSQCNSYIQGVWKNRLLIELWAHKHYLIGCSGVKLCHGHHLGALDPA